MSIPNGPRVIFIYLALLLGVMSASSAAIFIRLARADGLPALVIAALRLSIAALILLPLVLTKFHKQFFRLHFTELLSPILAGFFLAIHFATWISSLDFISVANSVLLVTTTPIWIALLSPLILKEKISRNTFLGLFIALAGTFVIMMGDFCSLAHGTIQCSGLEIRMESRTIIGNLLALIGALMAAGYLLAGRKSRRRLELIPYIFVVYGTAATFLISFAATIPVSSYSLTPPGLFWCLLMALFPQLLGHTSFNWSVRYLPASFVGVVMLCEPIASTILALLIFQESPGGMKILGGIILLFGIWLVGKKQGTSCLEDRNQLNGG